MITILAVGRDAESLASFGASHPSIEVVAAHGERPLEATDLGEVIAVRGSEAHQDLLDDGAVNVITTPTVDDAVLLLSSGKHDTLFGTDYFVMAAIRDLGITNIEPAPSFEMHMHHRFALLRAASRPDGLVHGKAVVYASAAGRFPAYRAFRGRDVPQLADLPAPGTLLATGEPALTIFSTGRTLGECARRLDRRAARMRDFLAEGGNPFGADCVR